MSGDSQRWARQEGGRLGWGVRLRVTVGLGGLLLATLLGAWMVAGGGVLRPLLRSLMDERVEVATYIASEVEAADDHRGRARELSEELGVRLKLVEVDPTGRGRHQGRRRGRNFEVVEVEDRSVLLRDRPEAPILVSMGPGGEGPPYLAVTFPVDLDAPPRRVVGGLLVLSGLLLVGSLVLSRWVMRPLIVAGEAMDRVAAGDLSHRVPAGADEGGRIGATFNRMADRVEGLVRGQRDLMAAVSHELRTPLARMRLQVEMLREGGADERRLDGLESDISEVDALVGELLESARLDQGAVALKRSQVVAAEVVDQALAAVDLGERPITVDVPAGLALRADRARLVRALVNLLTNVARYTPADAAVALSVRLEGDEAILAVADSGPGVPEDALHRLFDPFFRAEGSRSKATGGLGLGLMIVRQVAEAHGGSVSARTDGGLVVELRLPVPAT